MRGIHRWPSHGFPSQRASNAKIFPFDYVIMRCHLDFTNKFGWNKINISLLHSSHHLLKSNIMWVAYELRLNSSMKRDAVIWYSCHWRKYPWWLHPGYLQMAIVTLMFGKHARLCCKRLSADVSTETRHRNIMKQQFAIIQTCLPVVTTSFVLFICFQNVSMFQWNKRLQKWI